MCSIKLIVVLSLGSTVHYMKYQGPNSPLFASCTVSYDAASLITLSSAFFIATPHKSESISLKFLCVWVLCIVQQQSLWCLVKADAAGWGG